MTNLYQVSALKQYTSESNYVNASVLTESMMNCSEFNKFSCISEKHRKSTAAQSSSQCLHKIIEFNKLGKNYNNCKNLFHLALDFKGTED